MPLIQSIFHELDLLRTFPSNTRISTSDLLGTALVNIYYEIFRENPTMERRKDSSFAQNILIYINENYNKKITLKLLSEHFISVPIISVMNFVKSMESLLLNFAKNIRNNLYFCIQKEACTFVLHASFLKFILFLHNYFSTPLKYAL